MPGFDAGLPNYGAQFSGFTPANLGQSSTVSSGIRGFDPLTVGLSFISDAIGYHRQKKLMDKQYEQALDMWNRQNEYNDPSAQMERFRRAGLNPDLIYSQMGNGSPAQMVSTEQNVSQHDYGAALTASKQQRIAQERLALDSELTMSQIKLMDSEAERNRADARYKESGVRWNDRRITSQDVIDRLNESHIVVNDAQARMLESRCNEIGANIDLLKSKTAYTDALAAIANIDKAFKTQWWKAEISRIRSETALNGAQLEKLEQVIIEMKDSWELRFKNMQHDERINYSQEVMAMAQAAVNRWQYTVDEFGNPLPTKSGAAYHALDLAVGLVGRIVNVGINTSSSTSSNTNRNDFFNHSSWHETRGKNYRNHVSHIDD